MSIFALLNQVKDDEIVLPAIQRNFVWDEEQIVSLFDSIMRSYPIGIVLLWETFNDIQYRRFVRDHKTDNLLAFSDNPGKRKLKLVLDGQQRLQSLFVALYGTYNGRVLYFDALSGKAGDDVSELLYWFYFGEPSEDAQWNRDVVAHLAKPAEKRPRDFAVAYYVRVSEVYSMDPKDKKALVKKTRSELRLTDEDETRLELNLAQLDQVLSKEPNILKTSVIDQNLPAEAPSRKTEADVVEIFVRINQNGTRLDRADLMFSMLKLNWKESAEGLPEFVNKLNEGHSLDLDTDFVVRCLLAVSDLGAKFDLDILRKKSNVAKLKENFRQCCDALEATTDFIVGDCKCPSADLIGSRNVLVPFVYYFFHLPKHQIGHKDLPAAKRAFFFFVFSRVFTRWGDNRVGAFIRSEMKARDQDNRASFPVQAAFDWIQRWNSSTTVELSLLENNIRLALHLVQKLAGAKVQYTRNSPEIDHIFPASGLRKRHFGEGKINSLANYWILPLSKNRTKSDEDPSKYFKDVPKSELDRALINPTLLHYNRFEDFLQERGGRIVERAKKILNEG
jgi:hypothetical protein